ncbi:MAG: C40 family peptidase [Betaproteobacteria bacterium]|nr:C40 family peptidase [Betaproteobacteria bacterium]
MIKPYKLFGIFFLLFFLALPFWTNRANAEPLFQDATDLFERYSNAVQDVLLTGLSAVGARYRPGGTEPDGGLDCSGFVQFVYREAAGLVLPRTAKAQSQQGKAVDRADLKPGDLVFFNTMRRAFSHVGIYLGDSYFIHAPSSGGTVRLESMLNRYWQGRYNGARRLLQTENDVAAFSDSGMTADSDGT